MKLHYPIIITGQLNPGLVIGGKQLSIRRFRREDSGHAAGRDSFSWYLDFSPTCCLSGHELFSALGGGKIQDALADLLGQFYQAGKAYEWAKVHHNPERKPMFDRRIEKWASDNCGQLSRLAYIVANLQCIEEGDDLRLFVEPLPVNSLLAGYVTCALWSSNDNADASGGDPMDKNYSAANIDEMTFALMAADCAKFERDNSELLAKAGDDSQNGHDFWLTRNGHGAGFWDRGYPKEIGDVLSDKARAYGAVDLYIGDDKKIHA